MADTPDDTDAPEGSGDESPQTAAGDSSERPPLTVLNQYIKDLSFEAPTAPEIFETLSGHQPNISVNVTVQANALGNDTYEAVLQISSTCKAGDKTAFIIELSYGGVFEVHVSDQMLRPVLLIECPRLLFPFARHIVANATRDGGFIPLMLGPVDFVALYQRQVQQAQAGSDEAPSPSTA